MAGKLIVYGFNQPGINGVVKIILDSEIVAEVNAHGRVVIPVTQNCQMMCKCGFNKPKTSVAIKDGYVTEIQMQYSRLSGKITMEVLKEEVFDATNDIIDESQKEKPIYELDGGVGDILFVYEDRVMIRHKGALNFLAMGIKGDKTLYYADITSVQYKRPGNLSGHIQFSLPGGRESTGGVMAASSDENTITITGKGKSAEIAEKVVEFINQKIREYKTNKNGSTTVIQQTSAADELKKYKELLDLGIITQEEFDAKKKQLLGL